MQEGNVHICNVSDHHTHFQVLDVERGKGIWPEIITLMIDGLGCFRARRIMQDESRRNFKYTNHLETDSEFYILLGPAA